MRVRVKFSKYGILKLIGHLDVMRFFQKAIRRSNLDIAYSKGFSPHQIMSFAAPLGIGITSDGEYMDIELLSYPSSKQEFLDCLNRQMTEGFLVTDAVILPDPKPNQKKETAMSQVVAADYKLSFKHKDAIRKEETPVSISQLKEYFLEFMKKEEISITKKTKKSEQTLNLRPYIFTYGLCAEEFSKNSGVSLEHIKKGELHADVYYDTFSFYLRLQAGSIENIKPKLVIEAFLSQYGLTCPKFSIQQHRMELYQKNFIPLLSEKEKESETWSK